jgi:protein SCO1/2
MYSVRAPITITANLMLSIVIVLAASAALAGCRRQAEDAGERAGFAVHDASDCLPDITLADKDGQMVSLSSLKGKPVLFDFIYTTCPGPCLLLTARMNRIARQLGPALGTDARIVSITVDPEHDKPKQLLAFANEQGANVAGWLFLTGTSEQIDDVMTRFRLIREREADGTVDHVLEFFLVGPDGRVLLQYIGEKADPDRVASDMERAAAGKAVTESEGSEHNSTLALNGAHARISRLRRQRDTNRRLGGGGEWIQTVGTAF